MLQIEVKERAEKDDLTLSKLSVGDVFTYDCGMLVCIKTGDDSMLWQDTEANKATRRWVDWRCGADYEMEHLRLLDAKLVIARL